MDVRQKEKIQGNLVALTRATKCNRILLANLLEKGVLNGSDVDNLISIPMMSERTAVFYETVMLRPGSYSQLLAALHETGQDHVAQILLQKDLQQESSSPQPPSSPSTIGKAFTSTSNDNNNNNSSSKGSKIWGGGLQEAPPPSSVSFGVRPPSPFFAGRQSELGSLHKMISTSATRTAVISGQSGIGKSSLARKYVQTHGPSFNSNVLWMEASSVDAIRRDFTGLATQLGIPRLSAEGKLKPLSLLINECYLHFINCSCIVVLDNVESRDMELVMSSILLPSSNKEWVSVLITSREGEQWNRGSGGNKGVVVQLDFLELQPLSDQEGLHFVRLGLGIHDHHHDDGEEGKLFAEIKLLVDALKGFPLALQLAISVIHNDRAAKKGTTTTAPPQYTISDYLAEYQKVERDMAAAPVSFSGDYMTRIAVALQLSITKLLSKDSVVGQFGVEVLNLMAFFESEHIPLTAFTQLSGVSEGNGKLLAEASRLITSYSLVEGVEAEGGGGSGTAAYLGIHPLLQLILRVGIAGEGQTSSTLASALEAFENNLGESSSLLCHVISVWRYVQTISKVLVAQFAELPARLIVKLNELGAYDQAVAFGTSVLPALRDVVGGGCNDSPVITELEDALEISVLRAGNPQTALQFYQQLHPRLASTLGEKPRKTLIAKHALGRYLVEAGNAHVEGFDHMDTAILEFQEQGFEESDPAALVNMFTGSGVAAVRIGDLELARNFFTRALELQNKYFESDLAGVCQSRLQLATVRAGLGSRGEALQVFREVYAQVKLMPDDEQQFGRRNKSELISVLVSEMPKWLLHYECEDEALLVSLRLYQICSASSGPNDYFSLTARNFVGVSLLRSKRLDEALELFEELRLSLVQLFGARHELALSVLKNIGIALIYKGNYERAVWIFEEVLEAFVGETAPADRHELLESRLFYAISLYETGEEEKSLRLLKWMKDRVEEEGDKGMVVKERIEGIINQLQE